MNINPVKEKPKNAEQVWNWIGETLDHQMFLNGWLNGNQCRVSSQGIDILIEIDGIEYRYREMPN